MWEEKRNWAKNDLDEFEKVEARELTLEFFHLAVVLLKRR